MRVFEVPEGRCINCHHKLNGTKTLRAEPARPGDVTVCVFCGKIMQFGAGMELIPASEEVLTEVRKSALWGEVVEIQKRLNRLL